MFAEEILATVWGHCSVQTGELGRIMQKMQKGSNRLLVSIWKEG